MPTLAPPSLRLVSQTAGAITLGWSDPNPSDTGTEVSRAVGSGAFVLVASVSKQSVTWSDTALPVATTDPITVTYRVRAHGKRSDVSAWSNLVSTIITPGTLQPPCTINAASCSQADVQAAIDATSDGQVVCIPSGSATWTSGITVSKALTIRGQGSGRIVGRSTSSVTIGTGSKTFTTQAGLALSTGQSVRIWRTGDRTTYMDGIVSSYSGTTLVVDVTTTGGSGTKVLWVIATAPTTTISNNSSTTLLTLTESVNGPIALSGIKFAYGGGSADHIKRLRTTNGQPVHIHDCWFETGANTAATAILSSSNRGVLWNCSFDASPFSAAPLAVQMRSTLDDTWVSTTPWGALDTAGVSNFYIEDCDFHAYLNALDNDDNSNSVFRHCLFNNAGIGTHGADTSDYGQRHFECYDSEFVFNGYSDGTTFNLNWWFFVRGGTFLATDNIMPNITSTDFGDKTEVNLIQINLRRASGPNPCWGANIVGIQYPAPRQVGMGRVTGAAGTDSITYVGDSEPCYLWNNTGIYTVGVFDDGANDCTNPDSAVDYIISGRDYFDGTAKSGYTKYAYPHPLRAGK